MPNKLTAETSISINAPASTVWRALTDPKIIKQYLFGTDTTTDWKKGSNITYSGTYKGKAYKDKGKIIEIVPQKLLHTTYFSSMSGKEDKPENYNNVKYELYPWKGLTVVELTQDNIENEAELGHAKENWDTVLGAMKKVLENQNTETGTPRQ